MHFLHIFFANAGNMTEDHCWPS